MLLARRAAGMTQMELAKRIEGNNNTLAKVERGTLQFLRADAVGRIAQALGVSTDYLLGLTDNPTPPFALDEPEGTTEDEPLECPAQLELTAVQA